MYLLSILTTALLTHTAVAAEPVVLDWQWPHGTQLRVLEDWRVTHQPEEGTARTWEGAISRIWTWTKQADNGFKLTSTTGDDGYVTPPTDPHSQQLNTALRKAALVTVSAQGVVDLGDIRAILARQESTDIDVIAPPLATTIGRVFASLDGQVVASSAGPGEAATEQGQGMQGFIQRTLSFESNCPTAGHSCVVAKWVERHHASPQGELGVHAIRQSIVWRLRAENLLPVSSTFLWQSVRADTHGQQTQVQIERTQRFLPATPPLAPTAPSR